MVKLTKEDVAARLKQIEDAMQLPVRLDDPNGIWNKLNKISNLLANHAECLAQSELLLNAKKARVIESGVLKSFSSAADKGVMMDVNSEEELYLYNKTKAQTKHLHEKIEALRTLLSYAKKELETLKFNP